MFRLLARKPSVTQSVDLSLTPITTAAWLQILATLGKACTAVEIFNPSGSTIMISKGLAGQEIALDNLIPYHILPGGSTILLPINLKSTDRISVKAIDANATSGLFTLNFFAG